MGLLDLASFVLPLFRRQTYYLTRCLRRVKASKQSRFRAPHPVSAILRSLSRGRPSGEGVAKLCRCPVLRKGQFSPPCTTSAPPLPHSQTSKRTAQRPRQSACPYTSSLLRRGRREHAPKPRFRQPAADVVESVANRVRRGTGEIDDQRIARKAFRQTISDDFSRSPEPSRKRAGHHSDGRPARHSNLRCAL